MHQRLSDATRLDARRLLDVAAPTVITTTPTRTPRWRRPEAARPPLAGYARQKRRQARIELYREVAAACWAITALVIAVAAVTTIVVGSGILMGWFPDLRT